MYCFIICFGLKFAGLLLISGSLDPCWADRTLGNDVVELELVEVLVYQWIYCAGTG